MPQLFWLPIYLVLVFEAWLIAVALGPWTMRLARRHGFVAKPGARHIHREPTPALGGLAIVGGFVLALLGNLALALVLHRPLAGLMPEVGRYLVNIPSQFEKLGAVLLGALVLSVMGVADDRRPLPPLPKLGVMLLVALLPALVGVRLAGFLPGWFSILLTMGWIVLLTNAFNFLDSMDGLGAGVAAICSLAFALIYFFAGQWFMTAIFALLIGALLGFLRYNVHPAKMFMGDTGSLFIGYMIACLAVLGSYYESGSGTILSVLTPVVVLGLPLFDTLSVMWIRISTGKPLMEGDTNHFPHRLRDLGLSTRRTVYLTYLIGGSVALAALPLRQCGPGGAVALFVQVSLMLWIVHLLERSARRQREDRENDALDRG